MLTRFLPMKKCLKPEYIKEYKIDNKFILLAVRVSSKGTLFAKTLFTMTERKKNIYLVKGYAKKYE